MSRPRLALLAATVVAVLTTAGCAGSPASSGPVTVTFWHEMAGPAGTELTALVDRFNAAHRGSITVKASFQGAYADAQTKYTAAVQAGSTPSLLMMNDVLTGFMVDSGQTVPVDRFASKDSHFDPASLPKPVRTYYSTGSKLSAMPFSVSQPVLYVNRSLAERAGLDAAKPPTTFSQVVDWANRIHAKTGAYGYSMGLADSWILEELTAAGGEAFCTPANGREGGRVSGISMTSAGQTGFLTELQAMYTSGAALNPGADANSMNAAFTSGKVGMLLTSSGAYTALDPTKRASVVAAFPKTSDSTDSGVVIGGNALWISGPGHSDAEQHAAHEFASYLHSPESQAAWAAATGYLASNVGASSTSTGKASLKDPNIAAMYDQLAHTPDSTATAGCRTGAFPNVRTTVTSAFSAVAGGGQVVPAMQAAESKAKREIASYNASVG